MFVQHQGNNMINYFILLFVINGDGIVSQPQIGARFDDYNECMSKAIELMLDKSHRYQAACSPFTVKSSGDGI